MHNTIQYNTLCNDYMHLSMLMNNKLIQVDIIYNDKQLEECISMLCDNGIMRGSRGGVKGSGPPPPPGQAMV